MTDRRTFLKAAGAGTAALAVLPSAVGTASAAPAAAPAGATVAGRTTAATTADVFRHGVASGDPLGTAVVLWTRVTPDPTALPGSGLGATVPVTWQVAADPGFTTVVRSGTVDVGPATDHTLTVDATGLEPYTRYWYRFTALGVSSPVGRTQTAADDGQLHALRLAFVSCANYTGGFFTAYRALAARDDLDLVLHLGDYLYEYGNGEDRYGPAGLAGVRDHQPGTEMVSLADYRQRHAQYKADPDLQAAHAAFPWVVIFDDHEVTNDSFATGAENHTPGAEGDFLARRADAYRAYVEWMPIRLPDQTGATGTRFWRRFSFGPLADLSVVETRQNRSEQVTQVDSAELGSDERQFMEPAQLAWLTSGVQDPARMWHLVGNQTVFTRVGVTPAVPGFEQIAAGLGLVGVPLAGEPRFNPDQWDGYQDDQAEVVAAMAAAPEGVDTVVLTGDIHSSWANEVPVSPGTYLVTGSAAVEFVCPSVTSDGFSEILGGPQAAMAVTTGLQGVNPWIKYLDGVGHGFAVLDVTPERVQTDFWFITDREDPQATASLSDSWQSVRGTRTITAADAGVGPRSDSPRVLAASPPPVVVTPLGGVVPAAPGAPSPAAGRAPAVAPAAAPARKANLAATGAPAAAAAGALGLVAAGLVGLRSRGLAEEATAEQ